MNDINSFKEIRNKLIKVCIPVGSNVPLEFTIRPIKKSNESYEFQLLYLEYVGDQRCLYTCILSDELFDQECINLKSNSRNLLHGLKLSFAPTTLEEKLMAERMRVCKEGVTFYDFDFVNDSLVFNYNGVGYHGYLRSNGEWSIPETLNISNAMDLKRNPVNWRLFSYLKDRNVYTINLLTKESVQLTFNEDKNMGSGSTHFIIQEEFNRYEGMWWRPLEENNKEYHILIEEYDERMVDQFSIPDYTNGCNTEVYRYPRAGKKNAQSNLKILKIGLNSVTNSLTLLATLELANSLKTLFPQYEYLTNAGWTPDGKYVWIQMTDRLQNVKSTYLLPMQCFRSSLSTGPRLHNYAILFHKEENAQYWVPINNNTMFLRPHKSETSGNVFLYSSIMATIATGFNHLYIINKHWNTPHSENHFIVIDAETDSIVPLTSGHWQVDSEKMWVNEKEHLVYFLANRDDPIADYLYRVNYKNKETAQSSLQQITNQDTSVYFDAKDDWAVIITSSLLTEPQVKLIDIKNANSSSTNNVIRLETDSGISPDYPFGMKEIFKLSMLKYDIMDDFGTVIPLFGLLFTPKSNVRKSWPTIHYVYGGPGVRIIKNIYNRNFFSMAQMYNQFGYALLLCDGRGSTGRGIAFEGHIKNKMGVVELEDQIFFLRKAANETGLIDLDRVGIHGSSYGGYLTILALLKHSDVYQCGFSCSPVVDFRLYDTAYTERYLGIPESNPDTYTQADTLTYLNGLPTDRCRLAVAHGGQDENVHFLHTAHLMEAASSCGLDIKLLFYPTSRHRIKRKDHLETNIISFMNSFLQN